MRKAVVLAAFLFLSGNPASAATKQSAPPTQCSGPLGREFSRYIMPDVPLLSGIRTGMSRDQVRQIAPRLSLSESRQRLELFPGLSFLATAMFNNFFGGIETVRLSGSWKETPIEPLTAHYGEPITLDLSNSVLGRGRMLKWCDGKRVFVLNERPDDFILVITAERLYR